MIAWIAASVAVAASGTSVYFAIRTHRAVKRAAELRAQTFDMVRRRR